LKAILIIDIIIISGAAGAYFYLQKEGIITTGAATPAKFTLKDLTINPSNATLGDAVQISVNVTNVGELQGNDTINVEINNALTFTENITLFGGMSQNVTYNAIETTVGNYSVQVGTLTGAFKINPPPPGSSSIILSNINLNPIEAWPDQPVNVTATAENPSKQADRLFVIAKVDGIPEESRLIEINASSSITVMFAVNATSEGSHTVALNTLTSPLNIVKTGYHTLTVDRRWRYNSTFFHFKRSAPSNAVLEPTFAGWNIHHHGALSRHPCYWRVSL